MNKIKEYMKFKQFEKEMKIYLRYKERVGTYE